jgi:hypothetical protein
MKNRIQDKISDQILMTIRTYFSTLIVQDVKN